MTFNKPEFMKKIKFIKLDGLFNPYSDFCDTHDRFDAVQTRTDNLWKYISVIDNHESLIVGEAPGYLGARRTGLPFTDEFTLDKMAELYNLSFKLNQATIGPPIKERSATYMYKILERLEKVPFMWNAVPFHPHESDNQLSNRTPKKADFEATRVILDMIAMNFDDDNIYAIGNKAYEYLFLIGIEAKKIRHPSYGGAPEFEKGMHEAFSIKVKALYDLGGYF